MNVLMLSLSDEECGLIGNELNRLFLFQDRPFGKEKQAAFLDEIRGWGLPAGAIISGIRKLMAEDLKTLKLATVKEAAREFISREEEVSKCQECMGGFIVMHAEDRRDFSLACRCLSGQGKKATMGLASWDGQDTQFSKGRMLTRS